MGWGVWLAENVRIPLYGGRGGLKTAENRHMVGRGLKLLKKNVIMIFERSLI